MITFAALVALLLAAFFGARAYRERFDAKAYATRTCDRQCNLSQCGCVYTCPTHRGER
jgi:hypothetical protein